VRIIEGVAKALAAAHNAGIVHRDVKPSNILLDGDDFAYLIDFGIARALADTKLTETGNVVGTFLYVAPERLRSGDEDARADIYSLACVLYECLTGSPPFAGDSVERLITEHLTTPPPQPSTTQPNVPAQFDAVIAKGIAKDPDQRYATTVELANAARDAITVPIPRPTAGPAPNPPTAQAGPVTVPLVARDKPPSPPLSAASPPSAPTRLEESIPTTPNAPAPAPAGLGNPPRPAGRSPAPTVRTPPSPPPASGASNPPTIGGDVAPPGRVSPYAARLGSPPGPPRHKHRPSHRLVSSHQPSSHARAHGGGAGGSC
jgi:serine/threonine protein kinase